MISVRTLFIVIGLAFAVWLTDWAYRHFELIQESFRGPPSAEAQRDPWLAATRFLSQMGVATHCAIGRDRLDRLPPTTDALVVFSFGDGMDQQEFDRLMAWVNAGGQLVFRATTLFNKAIGKSGDPMLDKLGIELHYRVVKFSAASIREMSADALRKSMLGVAQVKFAGGESAEVGFDESRYLRDTSRRSDLIARDKSGYAHVIQIDRGAGHITVLSDMGFMANPSGGIEEFDNAWFLYRLLGHASRVWLVRSARYDPLLEVLWQSAPELCIGLLVMLAMWMWWLMDPFGPKRSLRLGSRRNILEQVLAATNFEWRIDKAIRRVRLNRELVMGELRRKHPVIRGMAQKDICAFLARMTGLDETEVALALFGGWGGEREFIELTAHLQQLREAL